MDPNESTKSFSRRWSETRATKTVVFWACAGTAIATMALGFTWGGWVTGATARQMAAASGEEAVVTRLTPICVLRVKQDPKADVKLKELQDIDSWQRGEFVKKQGWATMPGDQEPEGRLADACAKALVP